MADLWDSNETVKERTLMKQKHLWEGSAGICSCPTTLPESHPPEKNCNTNIYEVFILYKVLVTREMGCGNRMINSEDWSLVQIALGQPASSVQENTS